MPDPENRSTTDSKLNCYFCGKEIFEDDGSIEHIVSETAGAVSYTHL